VRRHRTGSCTDSVSNARPLPGRKPYTHTRTHTLPAVKSSPATTTRHTTAPQRPARKKQPVTHCIRRGHRRVRRRRSLPGDRHLHRQRLWRRRYARRELGEGATDTNSGRERRGRSTNTPPATQQPPTACFRAAHTQDCQFARTARGASQAAGATPRQSPLSQIQQPAQRNPGSEDEP